MKKLIAVAASVLVLGLVGCGEPLTPEQEEAIKKPAFERCEAVKGTWTESHRGYWSCTK